MQEETVVFWLFSFVIVGGVFIVVSAMHYRAKMLEMAHRERLAMIERGIRPAGDLAVPSRDRPKRRSYRLLSGGIVTVGFGLGMAMLLGFTSREPEIAVGVGGAIAILGAAFIVTALVANRDVPSSAEPQWPPSARFGQ